jgi:ligand-binding sensor domain-containing protein
VVPRASGGFILAQESGLCAFDPETQVTERLPWPADKRIVNRFNDGKCDPQGRFWVGTMGRNEPTGSLYRIASDFEVTEMLTGIRVSNGKIWIDGLKRLRSGNLDPMAQVRAVAQAEAANSEPMTHGEFSALLPKSATQQAIKASAVVTRGEALNWMFQALKE